MSTESNKATAVRIFSDILTDGNMAAVSEIFAPDFLYHNQLPDMPGGREGIRLFLQHFHDAFPDGEHTIHDQIAEGDRVVLRVTSRGTHRGDYMGIRPTGKTVDMEGIIITRFARGQAVEGWAIYEDLLAFQRLGGTLGLPPSGLTQS